MSHIVGSCMVIPMPYINPPPLESPLTFFSKSYSIAFHIRLCFFFIHQKSWLHCTNHCLWMKMFSLLSLFSPIIYTNQCQNTMVLWWRIKPIIISRWNEHSFAQPCDEEKWFSRIVYQSSPIEHAPNSDSKSLEPWCMFNHTYDIIVRDVLGLGNGNTRAKRKSILLWRHPQSEGSAF